MAESTLAFQKKLNMTVEQAVEKVTIVIKEYGFGVLTRIDFDQKIKEKLNKEIQKTVILGACNPKLAYEAFLISTDVALLVPCNITVREISEKECIVEAMRPSKMIELIPGVEKNDLIKKADSDLAKAISSL